jgi:hypothetical protein
MAVTLDQHQVFMQLQAVTRHQEAVHRIAGPGQPQAAVVHFQAQAFGGVDQAALPGQEGEGMGSLVHAASPVVKP